MSDPTQGDDRMEARPSDIESPMVSRGRADGPATRRSDARLDAAARQLADIVDRWNLHADDAPSSGVAEQLRIAVQELGTAHEQLRRQSIELADARALVEAERAKYRELFEIAPEGYVVIDTNGFIRELNHGAAAFLNLSPHYLIGKPIVTYVDERERREFRTRLYRAKTGMEAQEWTATFTHFDLQPLTFSVETTPVTNADGGVESIRLLLRDVSNSRSGRIAAREPAVIVRAALDALSAHVAVLDAAARIVTVNRAWAEASAPAGLFAAGTASGANYLDLCERAADVGTAGAHAVREAVASVLNGDRHRADVTYASATTSGAMNAPTWFALRVTRCDGPEPLHIVLTHEDITAERRSRERERELLEERAARAAAEAANKAKSEFLTTLSHELRTPLNAIAGYAQLLEMGVRGPVTLQQAEDLRRILRSERHLLGLINELLNFSRLERGQVSLNITPIRLTRSVAEVLELVEPQAAALHLGLTVDCPDPGVPAYGDPEKVRQILLNILSNALKFTRAGGAVRVECATDDANSYVRIHDNGVGIPPSMLSEIFDPFVQVNRGFGTATEGIGLGLAISRNLARAMHGDLTATSELGLGSSFELRLPRAPANSGVA